MILRRGIESSERLGKHRWVAERFAGLGQLPLNIDALAAIDPSYRDLVEVRTRPTPQLGDWNAANIAEQETFQLWTDKEPIP